MNIRCRLNYHDWQLTRSVPKRYARFRCVRCEKRVEGPHFGDSFPWPTNRQYHGWFRDL